MISRSRSGLLLVVFLLSTGVAAAQSAAPPTLSSKERSERIKALPEDERKWLTEYVEPIILPEEVNLFLQLTESHQREMFKTEFWKRRERLGLPVPYGPGYEKRYAQLREAAAATYDGLVSDAGRMVIRQ